MAQVSRRDFVKWLALTAAGAAALPQQIEAFERYYEINTPQVAEGLVSVDEIWISGMASRALPASLMLGNPPLRIGLNLFGGVIRWVAAPDAKIVTVANKFTWEIKGTGQVIKPDDFQGQISFVDQNMRRHYRPITLSGSLA